MSDVFLKLASLKALDGRTDFDVLSPLRFKAAAPSGNPAAGEAFFYLEDGIFTAKLPDGSTFALGGAVGWGDIVGTIADQTDLAAALALKAPLASPTFTGTPTAPTAASNTNSTQLSTTAFVQAVVSSAVSGLLDYKGGLSCSGNPNYPSASKGDAYHATSAGKIGGASGITVDIGDMIIATEDNAGGTHGSVGTSWIILEHNVIGALVAANNLSDLANAATARTNLGLGNVENTALSTWTGSTSLVTFGTGAITSKTEDTTPDASADYILTYDASANAFKKVKLSNLPGSGATGDMEKAVYDPQSLNRISGKSGTTNGGSGGSLNLDGADGAQVLGDGFTVNATGGFGGSITLSGGAAAALLNGSGDGANGSDGGAGGSIILIGGSAHADPTFSFTGGNAGSINLSGSDANGSGNGGDGGNLQMYGSPGQNAGSINTTAGGSLTMGSGDLQGGAASGYILAVDGSGTPLGSLKTISQGTEVNVNSVTNTVIPIDSTGSNVIQIMVRNLQISGTDDVLLQLGTSGGFQTSSYGGGCSTASTTVGTQANSSGFRFNGSGMQSTYTITGCMTLRRANGSNTWLMTWTGYRGGTAATFSGSGDVTLSGSLTQVKILTSGSNIFTNSGKANYLKEI